MKYPFWSLLILGLSYSAPAKSQVQRPAISYQGVINDANGIAINGSNKITISLYSDRGGLNRIWTDTFTQDLEQGYFNIALGSQLPLPDPSVFDAQIWLGVGLNGCPDGHPLSALSAVPYALSVPDSSITSRKLRTDYVSGLQVNGKEVLSGATSINLVAGKGIKLEVDTASTPRIIISSIISKGTKAGNSTQAANTPWVLGGNSIVSGDFLGTTNTQPLVLKTNSITAARFAASSSSVGTNTYPNVIGGDVTNTITASGGAVVGGGAGNTLEGDYSAIGGGQNNEVHGIHNLIGGGKANKTYRINATVIGGESNTAGRSGTSTDPVLTYTGGAHDAYGFATVGGGRYNHASGSYSAVVGGQDNVASGTMSFIGGGGATEHGDGNHNIASGTHSVVVGGESNAASEEFAFIGGGSGNVASEDYATIAGGTENLVAAQYGVIGGGSNNKLSSGDNDNPNGAAMSFIGGGDGNEIYAEASAIGGGFQNKISQDPQYFDYTSPYSFIGGGHSNGITAHGYNTIGGGAANWISRHFGYGANSPTHSFIGGGDQNYLVESHSVIGGGLANAVIPFTTMSSFEAGSTSSILGGSINKIEGAPHSSILGGEENWILRGSHSHISGGQGNLVDKTNHASIVSGAFNTLLGSSKSFLGGGELNKISYGEYSVIAGGSGNLISSNQESEYSEYADYSSIGGGLSNTIGSNTSFIGGGEGNVIDLPNGQSLGNAYGQANHGVIGGGMGNRIELDPYFPVYPAEAHIAEYATIVGGQENRAMGHYSYVGGGYDNQAVGKFSSVVGGQSNIAHHWQVVLGRFNREWDNREFLKTGSEYTNMKQQIGGSPSVIWDDTDFPYEPLLIIGNGTSPESRQNAFEVAGRGHTVVRHVNGPVAPAIRGATFVDNIVYAWGSITSESGALNQAIPFLQGFGVDAITRTGFGAYTVTLKIADNPTVPGTTSATAALTAYQLLNSSVVATLNGETCGMITTSPVVGNSFTVRTFEINANGTLNPTNRRFSFLVTGRGN